MKRTAGLLVLIGFLLLPPAAAGAAASLLSPAPGPAAERPPAAAQETPVPGALPSGPLAAQSDPRAAAVEADGQSLGRRLLGTAQALVDRMMAYYHGAVAWLREHGLLLA